MTMLKIIPYFNNLPFSEITNKFLLFYWRGDEINRAGEYITALGGVSAYKAYRPNPLPPFTEIEMDAEMTSLLSKASTPTIRMR